jgi:tetratricopeptide (TPR) repeat protein
MKNNKKGFVLPFIINTIAVLGIIGSLNLCVKENNKTSKTITPSKYSLKISDSCFTYENIFDKFDHTVYLMLPDYPDKDKDGLEDSVAETIIYGTDPKKFDSRGDGQGDGEYIYNIYRKAYRDNDTAALTQLKQFESNLTKYYLTPTNIIYKRSIINASLEETFNIHSSETYNFYIGLPSELTKMIRQALNFRLNNEYQGSLKLLRDTISANPDLPVLNYHLALTYHGMKNYNEAIPLYENLITNATIKSPLLYNDIASAYYGLGNDEKYIEYMEFSIKNFPENLDQYIKYSNYYQEKKQFGKAEEVLNKGLLIEPSYAPYYNELGIIAGVTGDNNKEFNLYKKAVSSDFRYARGHQNLAILLDEYYDKPEDGLVEARIAFDLDPSPYHLSQVLMLYNKTGNTLKAKELEEQLLKMENVDGVSFNNLGLMYLDRKNYPQAEQYFRKAIKVSPNLSNAYNNLGIVLSDTGRNEEAYINYKKAIEINPNYANAYSNLGVYYTDNMLYEKAIESFLKAIEINPGLYRTYGNIAGVYYTLGDKVSAKKYYQKVYDLGSREQYVINRVKELSN